MISRLAQIVLGMRCQLSKPPTKYVYAYHKEQAYLSQTSEGVPQRLWSVYGPCQCHLHVCTVAATYHVVTTGADVETRRTW